MTDPYPCYFCNHYPCTCESEAMTHPSKSKGNRFERELVNQARAAGLEAARAFASNGQSLGEAEAVDVVVNGMRIQAKRRKSLASYLQIPDDCDAVAFRQDRGPTLVLISYEAFLDKLGVVRK